MPFTPVRHTRLEKTKYFIGLFGNSGSGKTGSALKIAGGLLTPEEFERSQEYVVMIDGEWGRSNQWERCEDVVFASNTMLYPQKNNTFLCIKDVKEVLNHIDEKWQSDFGHLPKVVILDGVIHEIWDDLLKRYGMAWKDNLPRNNDWRDFIRFLQQKSKNDYYIIVTGRLKTQTYREDGKIYTLPDPSSPYFKPGTEYEFDILFILSTENPGKINRVEKFVPLPSETRNELSLKDTEIDIELGKLIKQLSEEGLDKDIINAIERVERIRGVYKQLANKPLLLEKNVYKMELDELNDYIEYLKTEYLEPLKQKKN